MLGSYNAISHQVWYKPWGWHMGFIFPWSEAGISEKKASFFLNLFVLGCTGWNATERQAIQEWNVDSTTLMRSLISHFRNPCHENTKLRGPIAIEPHQQNESGWAKCSDHIVVALERITFSKAHYDKLCRQRKMEHVEILRLVRFKLRSRGKKIWLSYA